MVLLIYSYVSGFFFFFRTTEKTKAPKFSDSRRLSIVKKVARYREKNNSRAANDGWQL